MKRWLLIPLFFTLPAFPVAEKTLKVKGGKIELEISVPKAQRVCPDAAVEKAVMAAAEVLVNYYGKFPVPRLELNVVANERQAQGLFGQAFGGRTVVFYLGSQVSDDKLLRDWILVHEMFHLGFPSIAGEQHDWIGEGLSTYLEGLARVRTGNLSPESLWLDSLDGFADAVPLPGEGGLNTERRYRRMYWGGALFWFLMDLEIRENSKGKKSLDDVMKLILSEGGTGGIEWTLEELYDSIDQVAGPGTGKRYYLRFGPKAAHENLTELWKRLGIEKRDGKIVFHADAPSAGTLKAMMSRTGK